VKAIKNEKTHLLRIDKGENITKSIIDYAKENSIKSGIVYGIGALCNVEIGYFDSTSKEYRRKHLEGIFELLSLTGNITQDGDSPFLHAHVVLGSRDFTLTGGHLFSGDVAVTGEIFIVETPFHVERKINQEIGLKLIQIPEK